MFKFFLQFLTQKFTTRQLTTHSRRHVWATTSERGHRSERCHGLPGTNSANAYFNTNNKCSSTTPIITHNTPVLGYGSLVYLLLVRVCLFFWKKEKTLFFFRNKREWLPDAFQPNHRWQWQARQKSQWQSATCWSPQQCSQPAPKYHTIRQYPTTTTCHSQQYNHATQQLYAPQRLCNTVCCWCWGF